MLHLQHQSKALDQTRNKDYGSEYVRINTSSRWVWLVNSSHGTGDNSSSTLDRTTLATKVAFGVWAAGLMVAKRFVDVGIRTLHSGGQLAKLTDNCSLCGDGDISPRELGL
jgi:hypothetical protein